MLKKLVMSAVFAASLASPALAQSYQPEVGSGNIVPPLAYTGQTTQGSATSAYAYEPVRGHSARIVPTWQRRQAK